MSVRLVNIEVIYVAEFGGNRKPHRKTIHSYIILLDQHHVCLRFSNSLVSFKALYTLRVLGIPTSANRALGSTRLVLSHSAHALAIRSWSVMVYWGAPRLIVHWETLIYNINCWSSSSFPPPSSPPQPFALAERCEHGRTYHFLVAWGLESAPLSLCTSSASQTCFMAHLWHSWASTGSVCWFKLNLWCECLKLNFWISFRCSA